MEATVFHTATTINKPETDGVNNYDKKPGNKVAGFVQGSESILLVKIIVRPKDTITVHMYMPTFIHEDNEVG